MKENSLFINNMLKSHRRMLITTFLIIILGNLAAIGIYFSGSATEKLTLLRIAQGLALSFSTFFIFYFIIQRFLENPISKYLSISMIGLVMFFFSATMSISSELFASFYLVMGLSLLYVDVMLTIYASALVMVLHTILIIAFPEVIPIGNVGTILAARYCCFLWFAIVGGVIAKVFRDLLFQSIENEEVAIKLTEDLKGAAQSIIIESDLLNSSSAELLNLASNTGKAAKQVSSAIDQLALSATEQATYATNTSVIVRQVSEALESAGKNAEQVGNESHQFREIVKQGIVTMEKQSQYMEESILAQASVSKAVYNLSDKSKAIEKIVDLINNIAGQTNLLALNAAIEAARAGEAGRGFAVVAEEVRKLAEESEQATRGITDLIVEIQSDINETVEEINRSNEITAEQGEAVKENHKMFEAIEIGAGKIDTAIQEVSAVLEEVLASTDEVVKEVEDISATTEESAASTEEITALVAQQEEAVHEIEMMIANIDKSAENLCQMANRINETEGDCAM